MSRKLSKGARRYLIERISSIQWSIACAACGWKAETVMAQLDHWIASHCSKEQVEMILRASAVRPPRAQA